MADEKDVERLTESLGAAADGTDAYTAAQQRATAAQKQAAEAFKNLGGSVKQLGTAMLSGSQGMSKYTDGLKGASDAVGMLAKGMGPLGLVIQGVTAIFTKLIGAALKQNDVLNELNRDFSKTGQNLGITTDRMLDMAHSAGFTINTMQGFQRAMGNLRSTTLTLGTTAAKGAENFAQMNKISDGTREAFTRLGYSTDDIIDNFANYAQTQGAFGLSQGKTVDQLRMGAEKYTRTLSELTALTGESRDELQKRNEQAAADLKFQLILRTEGKARADEFLRASQIAGSAGAGVRDFISGLGAAGEEGRKLMLSTGGEIVKLTEQLKKGEISAEEYNKRIVEAQQKTLERQGKTFIYSEEAAREFGITAERLQEMDKIRAGDPAAAKRAVEDAEKAGVDARKDAEAARVVAEKNAGQAADKLVNTLSGPVNSGLTKLAEMASKAADALGKVIDAISGSWLGKKLFGGDRASGQQAATAGGRAVAPAGVAAAPSAAQGSRDATLQGSNQALAGLNIKDIGENTGGGEIKPALAELANKIGQAYPEARFTAFNDVFHRSRFDRTGKPSEHIYGKALDFTLPKKPTAEEGAAIVSALKQMGASKVIDEYNRPSAGSTGGHIHAEVQAKRGGVFSGDIEGYAATLHGTEAVVPLPDGKTIPVTLKNADGTAGAMNDNSTMLASMMSEKFDQMIRELADINATQNEVLTLARAGG